MLKMFRMAKIKFKFVQCNIISKINSKLNFTFVFTHSGDRSSVPPFYMIILPNDGSGVRIYDGRDLKLFNLVDWGRSFIVCCLAQWDSIGVSLSLHLL